MLLLRIYFHLLLDVTDECIYDLGKQLYQDEVGVG
jgi:hypothetical protein